MKAERYCWKINCRRAQTRRHGARCSGLRHSSRAGEGEFGGLRSAAVTAETGNTSVRRKDWGSVIVLQSVQRDAHMRNVGDSEDVAMLELRNSNEGKNLSPGSNIVFFN